jgi:YD repeat-containing protein
MITRNTPEQGDQKLTWDATGKLTSVTGSKTGDSSYIYDGDGNLLL